MRARRLLPATATLAVAAFLALLLSGRLTSHAVQNPTISLDMVTTGNTYDDTTNTMTVGQIDSASTGSSNVTHIHATHLVIDNVEDLVAWQVRLNYIGDRLRPLSQNVVPFTDNVHLQNVGFSNLPIDQSTSLHRDVTAAASIPAAPPDNTNTPQTALVGAAYLGTQTFAVSPDTPAKATPDDSSYSAPSGGVLSQLNLQVLGNECNLGPMTMDLDDGTPNPPGSNVVIFTGSGTTTTNLAESALFDGTHTEICASPGSTTPTPTATAMATATATATPTGTLVTSTNDTGLTADDLHFSVHSSSVTLTAEVTVNAPGCAAPNATVSHTIGVDFTFAVNVVWPSPCVDSGESVAIRVSCPGSCDFVNAFACQEWTLSGSVLGRPCPTYFVVKGGGFEAPYGRIYEYSVDGTSGVVRLDVPLPPGGDGGARDITVDGKGRLAVFNGTFDPYLSTYDPNDGSWTHHTFPGWSTVNNVTYGGIAAFGDYVYVTDMRTFGDGGADEQYGIIRFDINDYSAQRFATPEFIDLNIGLNGLLYTVDTSERAVYEYDPVTMQLLRTFGVFDNVRSVAVDRAGRIFTAGLDGIIRRFDGGPNFEAVTIPGARLSDIDVSEDGAVVVSGGYQVVTDESLDHVAYFFDPPGALFSTFNTGIVFTTPVQIDIKPGSSENTINPDAAGVVPVAVFSTLTFDASTIDRQSVAFGPEAASPLRAVLRDVDGDGRLDLVLYFTVRETGIALGDTQACLVGHTTGRIAIRGCDQLRTVPR